MKPSNIKNEIDYKEMLRNKKFPLSLYLKHLIPYLKWFFKRLKKKRRFRSLKYFVHQRGRGSSFTRRKNRMIKEKSRCAHCGTKDNLTIDHIYPVSKGGSDKETNLQVLCKSCNMEKGDKIVVENIFRR